jgi:hypothetical protein
MFLIEEIISKINEKLKPSGWYDQLRIFLESDDFSDIIEELRKKVEEDKQRFCPALNTAFRFLEAVPFDKVKTIILIDFISNKLEQSNGICLSIKKGDPDYTPYNIFRSINQDYHDANKWAEQGVLILPLAITSRIEGKAHKKLWAPFILRIIEKINKQHSNVPWVFIGSDTWQYEEDVISTHIRKMELKNPIEDKEWSSWVNTILLEQKQTPIKW